MGAASEAAPEIRATVIQRALRVPLVVVIEVDMAMDKILIEATHDGLVTRLSVLVPGSEQKVR